MSRVSQSDARAVAQEVACSLLFGGVAAFFVSADMMRRIDEMLVTFLSIVVAAAIPGVALTAAAQRPTLDGPLETRRLGSRLKDQVRFWFGFLLAGGASVICIIASRALEWKLETPRPAYIPNWMPDGSAWLIFASIAFAVFTAIRARRIVRAVLDLIDLSTEAHVAQAIARRERLQSEVAVQLKEQAPDTRRGAPIENRPRH